MPTVKSTIGALLAVTLLSGCSQTITSCPAPTPIPEATQRAAAAQLALEPDDSPVLAVVVAGLVDRDKLRACRSIS